MIKFEKNHIELGKVVNVAKMPYQFKGANNYQYVVNITIKASCGCTTVDNNTRILKPGESFEINGNLTKRTQAVKTTKSVTVTVKKDNKIIQTERLLFTMDLINANDI